MEKLKKVGSAVALVLANLGILGVCVLVAMSLLGAMSGCDNKKPKLECHKASAEEVAKELGEGYSVKQIGKYSFITKNGETVVLGNQTYTICSDGDIDGSDAYYAQDIRHKGELNDTTLTGISEARAEESVVKDALGSGYRIDADPSGRYVPHYALYREELSLPNYISYGGQIITGGFESFYMDSYIIYGRLYGRVEMVRDAKGNFTCNNGIEALLAQQKRDAVEVLNFLGKDWNIYQTEGKVYLTYKDLAVTDKYDRFVARGKKIYGVNGAAEEEVLVNQPNIPCTNSIPLPSLNEPPVILGKSCEMDGGDLGIWIDIGAKTPICYNMPEAKESANKAEPTPTAGLPAQTGTSCIDIFGKASTIKCDTETKCECVPNQAIVDEIEKQLPDSPALQSAWKELGFISLDKKLNDSASLPPIKDVAPAPPCGLDEFGGHGVLVNTGDRTTCLHLPQSFNTESPVGQECTTNDNEPGKLERDVGPQYKLGHGYQCVPLPRGF